METNFETNIPQPPKKGNRILAYTLGFLFLFSVGTYAFGAALYHPGDTNDPSCAPGGPGCYVSVFPDDTGHSGEFLTTDGSGNASWAPAGGLTPTLQDVLNTGAVTDGAHPIVGHNFLEFDSIGRHGILNANGDSIFGNDTNDNAVLTGYNASHAAKGTVGFDADGNVLMEADNVSAHVAISPDMDAYSNVGLLSAPDLGILLDGSFNFLDDRATDHQDFAGVTRQGFGVSSDAAGLAHADSSHSYSTAMAYDVSGVPTFTTAAVDAVSGQILSTTMTPGDFQITTGFGKQFQVNPSSGVYGIGDLAGRNNSTALTLDDSTNSVSFKGYLLTGIPPPAGITIFTGSGLDDLSKSGTFSGPGSATYTVTVASSLNGTLSYGTLTGGTFSNGDTITQTTGAGAGSTATIVSDDGFSGMTVTGENETGGGFAIGETISNGSGITAVLNGTGYQNDQFNWTATDGGSASGVYMTGFSQLLSNGISITFGSFRGPHHVGDHWSFSYVYPAGRMLAFDGRAGTFDIGDVDGIGNGTEIKVNDGTGTVSIVGSGGTCTFDGSALGGTCFSDERLKTNVADLPSALDKIDQLRAVTYNWIDPKMPQTTNTGFIAQEVQNIFPELVGSVGDSGYLGVKYEGFIVPAIKAIQELDLKIKTLDSLEPTVNGSLASLILQFLQNAVVTIKEATIGTLRVSDQVCADDVCVTKDQFKNLLLQAGGTSSTPPASPVVPPADPVTPPSDPVTPPATDPVVTPPADSGSADSGTTPPTTDPGTPADPAPAS